jgi:membrane-associated phospholipid phosphatase
MNTIIKALDNFDKRISQHIHDLELPTPIEYIVYCFARMFNPDLVIFYFLIMAAQSFPSDKYFIAKPFIHTLCVLTFSTIVKRLTKRPRPNKNEKLRRVYDLRQHETNFSMPSGDSIQAANFAVILYIYYGTTIGFYFVPCVMFARMFFFCHYVFDTIVGSMCGFIISSLIYLILF